jgi:hypothetical protein
LWSRCGAQSTPRLGEGDGDVDSEADADADTDADGDAEPLVVEPGCVFPTTDGPEVVGSIPGLGAGREGLP